MDKACPQCGTPITGESTRAKGSAARARRRNRFCSLDCAMRYLPAIRVTPVKRAGTASTYIGVYFRKGRLSRPWAAEVKHKGKTVYREYFGNETEAALARDDFARQLQRVSRMNFPRPGELGPGDPPRWRT